MLLVVAARFWLLMASSWLLQYLGCPWPLTSALGRSWLLLAAPVRSWARNQNNVWVDFRIVGLRVALICRTVLIVLPTFKFYSIMFFTVSPNWSRSSSHFGHVCNCPQFAKYFDYLVGVDSDWSLFSWAGPSVRKSGSFFGILQRFYEIPDTAQISKFYLRPLLAPTSDHPPSSTCVQDFAALGSPAPAAATTTQPQPQAQSVISPAAASPATAAMDHFGPLIGLCGTTYQGFVKSTFARERKIGESGNVATNARNGGWELRPWGICALGQPLFWLFPIESAGVR